MQNLPNITPLEVSVVCSAALLVCIAPGLVGWLDGRRRRQLELAAAQRAAAEAAAAAALAQAVAQTADLPFAAEPAGDPAPADTSSESFGSPVCVADVPVERGAAAVVATGEDPGPEKPAE